MSDDKTKILEKIKKCFALAKSSNEHEAAAALRQAQKLMAMHGLTESDVEGVDYAVFEIASDYEFGRKKPLILIAVVGLIAHAMGVEVVFTAVRKGRGFVHGVCYAGPRHRVITAEYAHAVVYRAVGKAWREYSDENPWVKSRPGSRAGFYHGWCAAVRAKVEALAVDPKESEGTKRALARRFPEMGVAKVGSTKINGNTMAAGADRGKDFELNKPINQDRMRLT